ncbi:hypothetical protein FHS85_004537 [Rhodoligotrophos appendicifer]|uniref:NIPSNAP family protein n=1 Tax=Rhodoligotrophos appendicifer TaxID=987056 RepID=UPI001184B33F|nr:NIPSNAP family protein [Rhodoligotrophos appendicifer]
MAQSLFELRQYRVADGRMQEEIDRALTCILPPEKGGLGLFARYGIPAPVGMWRAISGPNLPCVVFVYEWPSVAARAAAFESFYVDPAWQEERARSNGGQEIVDRLDDLLLVGEKPRPMTAGQIYEFARATSGRAPEGVVASFSPLCGNDISDVWIIAHSSLVAAVETPSDDPGSRLFCELIDPGIAA